MTATPRIQRLAFFTRLLDAAPAAERYRLAAEQIAHAEAQGYDAAWVAQHHFHEHEGGLPSPFVFLGHVAAQTKRIRLGTGIITLPLELPVRVAEDAIVLDLISNGRLELGVGNGGNPTAFAGFELANDDRTDLFLDNLARLRAALTGDPVPGGDTLYPQPPGLANASGKPHSPSPAAPGPAAAGDGLMLSRTQPRPLETPDATLADLQDPIIDAYLAALPPGRAAPHRRLPQRLRRRLPSRGPAPRGYRPAHPGCAGSSNEATGCTGDTLADIIKAFDVHVGTPADVVSSLTADKTSSRVTDLAVQVHSIDPPHPLILRSIELVAQEVAPAFGWRPEAGHPHPVTAEQAA